MTPSPSAERTPGRQLRLWPGVAAVAIQWVLRFGVPLVVPGAAGIGIIGGVLFGLAVLVWWIFFSRVPKAERWGGIAFMIAALAATPQILHPSIVGGMMGNLFWIQVIPGMSLALVAWAVVSRSLDGASRRLALAMAILAACGFWAFVRTDGVTGEGVSQLAWRWKPTAEQQLLAQTAAEPVASPKPVPAPAPAPATEPAKPAPAAPVAVPVDWPGFRGPHRDSIIAGVRINTGWAASPPVELWRRPVGPGWSSFAVGNGRLYTQEQRGAFEIVGCYDAATGTPVWTHRDVTRFYESNGGAGPRGTPALHNGRIYSLGATGILNALDAGTGAVVWTRNAAADTGAKLPGWGFTSSPLVVDDLVVVAASGRLAAYTLSTGAPRWLQSKGGGSYSSPQLLTIGGVAQIVFLNDDGAAGVAPADGKVLWTHPWSGAIILQPALTPDDGLLIAASDMTGGVGVRRLAIARSPAGWTAEEKWTTRGLKPYFNDFVVHSGHAYGFDGSILACINLEDGTRKWKGGRYGNGQLLLLADQDLLLVLSEEGELALVSATPAQFTEIARIPAMEGKTWNHPVLTGSLLLVRNGREMVAFRLARAGS